MSATMLLRLILSLSLVLGLSATCSGQCGDSVRLYAVNHVDRSAFNTVDTLAGTQVIGDYSFNWYTYVSASVTKGGQQLHSASDDGYEISGVQFLDAPSDYGPGTWLSSNYHYAECDVYWTDYVSTPSRTVNQPTIGNLPYENYLWYFGPGTPGAVPTVNGGYYYQYANLTFNKNCGAGDTCSGTPTWSEDDPNGYISLSCSTCSGSTMQSTGAGTCSTTDSSVTATLNGWAVGPVNIGVASPSELISAGYLTTPWEGSGGYRSFVYWNVGCNCEYFLVQSVPLHEYFGTFQNPTSNNWGNPTATGNSAFNINADTFADQIAVADNASLNPHPVYTGDPGSGNTLYKYAPQEHYMGSSTLGTTSGLKVYSGWIEYYIDHGNSHP
jgi:hypothetical protein